jgi:hypothetical protein
MTKRPLKIIEVQYAWAVKDSENELDKTAILNAEGMLLACCGLVTIDRESESCDLSTTQFRNIFRMI